MIEKTSPHHAYGNYLTIIGISGIIATAILGSLRLTGKIISEQTTPSIILNILLLASFLLIAVGLIIKGMAKD